MTKQYHYIYKITCLINQKFYIGLHSTNNINDGYFGSGKRLWFSINKYGKNNFKFEILEYLSDRESLIKREKDIVNEELLLDPLCMNIKIGGNGGWNKGYMVAKDSNNKNFYILLNDPRYLSGELISMFKNKVAVKDKDNNKFSVTKNDPRYLSGELKGITTGFLVVKDKDGNTFQVSKDDPRYLSGELVSINKNKLNVKDKEGNKFKVSKYDPRYLSGELIALTKGMISNYIWINNNIKNKRICNTKLNEYLSNKWVTGRLNFNFNLNKIYIHNPLLNICKKINKDELNDYLLNGWLRGHIKKERKIYNKIGYSSLIGTIWIKNSELKQTKKIKPEELDHYINIGWLKGKLNKNKKS